MNFLKNFFNDDSKIVGLCGFDNLKPNYCQRPVMEEVFFNPYNSQNIFETNFRKNVLL